MHMTCEKCQQGEMEPRWIWRLSGVAAFLGVIVLLVGLVGLALGGIMSATACASAAATLNDRNLDETSRAIAGGVGSTMGAGMMVATVGGSIPLLVGGVLLTLKRHVWRCANCGYFYDRTAR
jgi:hypothetical protein